MRKKVLFAVFEKKCAQNAILQKKGKFGPPFFYSKQAEICVLLAYGNKNKEKSSSVRPTKKKKIRLPAGRQKRIAKEFPAFD